MGKYSNVNATHLKSTAETALKELANYGVSSIQISLRLSNVLKSGASAVVDDVFNDIDNSHSKNGSIKTLKNKLKKLISAADYIIKYQQAESEINNLNGKLYKEHVSYETTEDAFGNKVVNRHVSWVLDTVVQYRIHNLENDKKTYETKIDTYLS